MADIVADIVADMFTFFRFRASAQKFVFWPLLSVAYGISR